MFEIAIEIVCGNCGSWHPNVFTIGDEIDIQCDSCKSRSVLDTGSFMEKVKV